MRRENEFRYLKLANILREQIHSGFIKPGEFLLSENELCKHYGMSRTSVRKSLDQLLMENLIVKKVGQGTIVSPDVVVESSPHKVLRIFATSPSYFYDFCMPLLIEAFRVSNPNVEVKCMSFSAGDFWESVNTSMDLGLHPDLILVSDRQFGDTDNLEQFMDLQDKLSGSQEGIYPILWQPFSDSGRLKALPVTFSTVYLAYNPELFKRYGVTEPSPSWTQDDFLDAAGQLTMDLNGDGINDLYGLSLSSSLSRWPVIALQNGVNFKEVDSTEPILNTLKFLHDLLYKRRTAILSTVHAPDSESFKQEKAAMVLTTTIELAGWKHQTMSFTPKIAPLPFGKQKQTMLIANVLMLPNSSEEPELALQFLQTAVSPEVQQRLSATTGFISVRKPINEAIWSQPGLESLQIYDNTIENSRFLHEIFDDANLVDELESEMTLFWAGIESASELAERMKLILTKA
ncbi:extracellular solute-binding protein [Paenibacillus mendelii]|uniref:Extracellular solute-binding protein n=1 Tax=Paenibacillus mendelii TaxID=206163 RepID=A0ABV6JEM2_9BACL|nr:extracellular solute-binding protein [Paenibacillus mendelii]MCQ6557226.1 extracellular solute-binding protein [Paenibacillus mendelii]